MRTIIIAANWKMNKSIEEAHRFALEVHESCKDKEIPGLVPIIAPAYPYLGLLTDVAKNCALEIAAQDVSAHLEGAFTGEVSAAMLASMDIKYAIVGHSERRQYHHESNELIREKLAALQYYGLTPILCIGESLNERDAGSTYKVLEAQLEGCLRGINIHAPQDLIIAYEPVWAIGTGRTATGEQAQEAHAFIRSWLGKNFSTKLAKSISIIYGGSVNPKNLAGLLAMADIDGGLIGGASLVFENYRQMIHIALEKLGVVHD